MNSNVVICILGAQNDSDGALSTEAHCRLETALRLHRLLPGSMLLPTGGWGAHFNTSLQPHWKYLRNQLLTLGVSAESILDGVNSSNTYEDFTILREQSTLSNENSIIFVTSDYHVPRASLIANSTFPYRHCFFPVVLTHGLISPTSLMTELNKLRRIFNDERCG